MKYLITLLLILISFNLYSQSEFPAIEGKEIRLPLTDMKTMRYIGYLYAKSGSLTGHLLRDVVVDIFNSKLDSTIMVKDMALVPLYSLEKQTKKEVKDFWDKYPHSEMIIHSKELSININSRRMMGDSEVKIYSLGLDLIGQNYVIDMNEKSIEIKNGVTTLIRQDFITEKEKNNNKQKEQK